MVIAVEAVGEVRFEADEEVGGAVVVEVGPAVGLGSRGGEEFGLDGFEVLGCGGGFEPVRDA